MLHTLYYPQPARPTTAPNAGGTTAASTSTTTASSSAHAGEIREGSRVVITKTGHRGVVKYIGTMKQAEGEFIGVELDLGAGLNDGSVMGRKVSDSSLYVWLHDALCLMCWCACSSACCSVLKMCESQVAQPMSKHVCVRAVHTLCTNDCA
jgi:dynactin complex subunit